MSQENEVASQENQQGLSGAGKAIGIGAGVGIGIIALVVVCILAACVIIAILLLLGPVVGNVFSNVVENLGTPMP